LLPIVVHCHHRRRWHCRQATTASTTTTMIKLTVIHCQRKATAAAPAAYQRQHQRKTFTSPDDLDLFNLSTVFEVYDNGRGNLVISKLLTLKKL
jgi:hypothetical protein